MEGRGGECALDREGLHGECLEGGGWLTGCADGSAEGTAELAHDPCGFQAVADHVADSDGEAVSPEVEDVIPIATDVE